MRLINKIIKMAVGCIQKNMSLDKLCANYQYISFDIFDTLIEKKMQGTF